MTNQTSQTCKQMPMSSETCSTTLSPSPPPKEIVTVTSKLGNLGSDWHHPRPADGRRRHGARSIARPLRRRTWEDSGPSRKKPSEVKAKAVLVLVNDLYEYIWFLRNVMSWFLCSHESVFIFHLLQLMPPLATHCAPQLCFHLGCALPRF